MNGRANDTHEDITRNARHRTCQTVQVGVRKSPPDVCTGVRAEAEPALTICRMQMLQDSCTGRPVSQWPTCKKDEEELDTYLPRRCSLSQSLQQNENTQVHFLLP
jgi:hypothetical protein